MIVGMYVCCSDSPIMYLGRCILVVRAFMLVRNRWMHSTWCTEHVYAVGVGKVVYRHEGYQKINAP